MGISKIGSLFAANVDSLANRSTSSSQQQSQTPVATSTSSRQGGEAVVLASSIARAAPAAPTTNTEDRSARVAQLKDQVGKGQYKPDSRSVAVSVIRDLA